MLDYRRGTGRRAWKAVLAMAALALAQGFCLAQANDNSFQGSWAYKQTCGQHHAAQIKLIQTGTDITGEWSDGTQASGSDGKLKGSIHDGKLFVRYCGTDEQAGYAVCPDYEASETDYFVRQGADLVWYQMTGKKGDNTFRKYVVLHASVNGKPVPGDSKCSDG
jgi:hypothetical protein